ncbi:MAG: hypothetical protein EOO68_19965 [Moraxellaceae bacterium]|nr:MAG: hypothetical protein EOO68_19965 [Moraxellaceae bacterium]
MPARILGRMPVLSAIPVLLLSLWLMGCKVVNTHTVKIISSPTVTADSISFRINKGQTLQLATGTLSAKQQQILQNIQLQQCLDISSNEPFTLQNGIVRFSDFKFKKLLESDSKCRKLKPRSGIRVRITP